MKKGAIPTYLFTVLVAISAGHAAIAQPAGRGGAPPGALDRSLATAAELTKCESDSADALRDVACQQLATQLYGQLKSDSRFETLWRIASGSAGTLLESQNIVDSMATPTGDVLVAGSGTVDEVGKNRDGTLFVIITMKTPQRSSLDMGSAVLSITVDPSSAAAAVPPKLHKQDTLRWVGWLKGRDVVYPKKRHYGSIEYPDFPAIRALWLFDPAIAAEAEREERAAKLERIKLAQEARAAANRGRMRDLIVTIDPAPGLGNSGGFYKITATNPAEEPVQDVVIEVIASDAPVKRVTMKSVPPRGQKFLTIKLPESVKPTATRLIIDEPAPSTQPARAKHK